jgi:beta-lactamase class D
MSHRTPILFLFGTALLVSTANAEVVCTALADASAGKLLKREGICDKRVTPASSFKIAISLMGYDAGFLIDEHQPALPFRKGYPDWNPTWRAATDPTSWIKNSVVWFSQQVTEWLGEERFHVYIKAFHYGNEDVSGNPGRHDGLTQAWLSSSLKISPLEQLAFLEKVVRQQLPLTRRAYEMTSRITKLDASPNGWDIHGKAGTGFEMKADGSSHSDHALGWFVGWAMKNGRTVVFARLIQDHKAEPTNAGLRARDAFLAEVPLLLGSY